MMLWDILNTVAQLLMVFASFVTIFITMYQLRDEKKEKICVGFVMAEGCLNKKKEANPDVLIGIKITNIGNRPAYIQEYGISIFESSNSFLGIGIDDNILINPGETIQLCKKRFIKWFCENEDFPDKCPISVYVITGKGKRIVYNTSFHYIDIVKKIKIYNKKIDEMNGGK